MSITINYEGTLDDPSRINEFIYDMKFHCRKLDWPCREVNERILGDAYYYMGNQLGDDEEFGLNMMALFIGQKSIDDRIRGVLIEPPGTESLNFTFNRAGELANYTPLPGRMTMESTPSGQTMSYSQEPGYYLEAPTNWISTTGQVTSHVLIVGLLRYLQTHHMSDLEVHDASEFWNDMDLKSLQWEHGRMNALLNYFRKPETIKSILEAAGIEIEGIENVRAVTPEELNVRPSTPEHMKGWGISAYEN